MWVSQGVILGPILFIVFINDLHCTIKYCKPHHFFDDNNLTNFQTSVKRINKQKNDDLKTYQNDVILTKFLLNQALFMSRKRQLDHKLEIKLNGKKVY